MKHVSMLSGLAVMPTKGEGRMKTRWFTTIGILTCALGLMAMGAAPAEAGGRLVLQIHQVKAIDETGGGLAEKLGSDEIALSGLTIDATGTVRRVRTLQIGTFKKDGVTKTFSPPLEFASFDLSTGASFPKHYQAMLVLAEKDPGGGLGDFLEKLKTKAASKPAGESAEKGDVAVIAALLGKKAAEEIGKALLTEATAKMKGAWKDDIFPPSLEALQIPGPSFRFPHGRTTSEREAVTFKKHNGNYRVVYSWDLRP